MGRTRWSLGLALCAALAGCGDDDDAAVDGAVDGGGADVATAAICGSEALVAALAAAGPGSVVEVGACTVQGHFIVPSGVTLRGAGRSSTRLRSHYPTAGMLTGGVLEVQPGPGTTRIEDLILESNQLFALRATGAMGALEVRRVDVFAYFGDAIEVADLPRVTLEQVQITGKVERNDAPLIDFTSRTPDPETWPLAGVRLTGNVAATLSEVTIQKFAVAGIHATGAALTLERSTITANTSAGIALTGGTAMLTEVTISSIWQTARPSYGAIFRGGAQVTSNRLKLVDNERYGIVHVGGSGNHSNLELTRNSDAGLWADDAALTLTAPSASRNKLAAVVLRRALATTITGGTLADTVATPRAEGMTAIIVGDGLLVISPAATIDVQNLTLTGNGRVGVLLDHGTGPTDRVRFTNVTVSGMLGAIAQTGTAIIAPGTGGWDAQVTRTGGAEVNDPLRTSRVDIPSAPTQFP